MTNTRLEQWDVATTNAMAMEEVVVDRAVEVEVDVVEGPVEGVATTPTSFPRKPLTK
jgi:hypothetical protein